MAAPAHPTPNASQSQALVVIPVSDLETMIDSIISKHLHNTPKPKESSTEPRKASFRTRAEAAKALGISISTLNTRLHDDKTVPFKRIGRRILIPESYFEALEKQDNA